MMPFRRYIKHSSECTKVYSENAKLQCKKNKQFAQPAMLFLMSQA